MIGVLGGDGRRSARVGVGTVSFCAAEGLEIAYRHETAGVGQGRVAGFVPVAVVFSTDDMEKVSARKAEFLASSSVVIIKRPDNLGDLSRASAGTLNAGASGRHRGKAGVFEEVTRLP